jgi:hypothetical protein
LLQALSHTDPDPLSQGITLQKDDASNIDLAPSASDDVGQLNGPQNPDGGDAVYSLAALADKDRYPIEFKFSSQPEHLVVKDFPKSSFLLDTQIQHPLVGTVDLGSVRCWT